MAEKIISEYIIKTNEAIGALDALQKKYIQLEQELEKLKTKKIPSPLPKGLPEGLDDTRVKFNALGNSINQLGREIPAFANSAQTGFLAISNNIPALTDAIGQLRKENELLAAQGKATVPIYKQLASAFFSFNTLISLGITLLTVYGKEIGNFIAALFRGNDEFDIAKERLNALNEAYASKNLKTAVLDLVELNTNVKLARDGFISKEEVIKQYNQTLGKAFGSVNTLDEAEKGLVNNTKAYVDAIVAREAAARLASRAADILIKIRETELKEEKDFVTTSVTLQATQFKDLKDNSDLIVEQKRIEKEERERLAKEAKETQLNELKAELEGVQNLINGFSTNASKVAGGGESLKTPFELLNEEIAKTKLQVRNGVIEGRNIEADVKKLEELETQLRIIESTIERTRDKTRPEDEGIDTSTLLVGRPISEIQQTAEAIKKEENEINRTVLDNAEKSKKANKEVAREFAELEKEKTKAVEEEAQKRKRLEELAIQGAFSIASSFEQGLFNLKQANLDAETNSELKRNKELLDQKLISQEEFDRREAEIKNEAARKQRELDLAQIKVQTALAIVKAFATLGFPAGLLAAGIAAAEGALQYSFAQAQPLPQFAQGTDRVIGGIKGKDSVHALLMPDEAVIPAEQNMKYKGLSKAWVSGNLDNFLAMNYITPAIEKNNREWERQLQISQNSTFIRKDNFNDKRIVEQLSKINRKLSYSDERISTKGRNKRLWN